MDTAKTSQPETDLTAPDGFTTPEDASAEYVQPSSRYALNGDDTRGVLDTENPFAEHADSVSDVAPLLQTPTVTPPAGPRPMNKSRFATGLMFAASGMTLMLVVAFGAMQNAGALGRLSLPAVGLCMIIGLMLLGGGFGVMATSAATFDDGEFERLMRGLEQPLQSRDHVLNQNMLPQAANSDVLAAVSRRDESAA